MEEDAEEEKLRGTLMNIMQEGKKNKQCEPEKKDIYFTMHSLVKKPQSFHFAGEPFCKNYLKKHLNINHYELGIRLVNFIPSNT